MTSTYGKGSIPLPINRSNEGLETDEKYVASAIELADQLQIYCALSPSSKILDFGSGQGRLAIGMDASSALFSEYIGIDTDSASIEWSEKNLSKFNSKLKFLHLPVFNARYNVGTSQAPQVLPLGAGELDIVFLNSVFSHMLYDDIRFYLEEFNRVLSRGGLIYTTCFVESNVPNVEENPQGYLGRINSGALHRVRYEKEFFLELVQGAGFTIKDFVYRGVSRTQQSIVVASKI